MDWRQALELEIARRGHQHWRVLTADSHPDHLAHRAQLVWLVTGDHPEPEVSFEHLEAIRLAMEAKPPSERRGGCCH